jgi:putative membrane protein
MFLDLLIRGFIVGLSFTIPGCSGGTFAVYVGVYDRLLHALGNIFKEFKKSMAFLVPFGIGLAGGILLFSWLMGLALRANSFITIMTFIGLTLGGVPNLWKNVKGHPAKTSGIAAFVIAFAIVVVMVVFQIIGGFDPISAFSFDFWTVLLLFGLGIISAITMIVPGVSGSGLLMILGFYTAIVSNVVGNLLDFSRFWYNLAVLVPFALGAVAGVIGISKVLESTLRKYPVQSYLGIIGFVVASGLTMFLWIRNPSTGDAFLDQAPLYADYAGYLSTHVPTVLIGILGLAGGLFGSIKLIAWGTKNANDGR